MNGVNDNEPMTRGNIYEFTPDQARIALSRTFFDAARNSKPYFERAEEVVVKQEEPVQEAAPVQRQAVKKKVTRKKKARTAA